MIVAILTEPPKPLVDVVPVAPRRGEGPTEYALQRVGSDRPSSIRFPTATEAVLTALSFAEIRTVKDSTSSSHVQTR